MAAIMPSIAWADATVLASWTFDHAYDATSVENVTTYVPNSGDATDVTGWFVSVTPIVRPDTYTGDDISKYTLTALASNRYFQFCTGYQNRVMRIDQNVANAITDFTDGSQHDNYYEISFPTKNYKDINIEYACAYGGNAAATLKIVVSVDGGKTWTSAGEKECATGWWLYNKHTVGISAANKENVIVRLICGNEYKSNWNMDYISVSGTYSDTFKTMYQLNAKINPAGAGSLSVTPSGSEFEEGTEVSIVANENFGYHFVNWTDQNGNILGTGKTYSLSMNSDKTVIANYNEVATYELTYSVEGGANDYFISVAPSPVMVGGKKMYEEGTNVTLTAANNDVLNFLKWEDNSTNASRVITMDGDKNAIATYSARDYIVGWDLFSETPKSDRPADFFSNDDNKGMMMLTTDGTTQKGWLSHTGWVGHHCAISWQNIADKAYFQWQFATTGKKNITFKITTSAINYSRYSTYNLQYSTDNAAWTTAEVVDFSVNTSWTTLQTTLPEACNDQATVYIRLIPAADATVLGSGNDCLAVTDIYVTYEKGIDADDTTAPVLESTLPADNAVNVSTSGSVILTFDESIALAENAAATINGEKIIPTLNGKSAIFAYSALPFSTAHTFTLPANSITDLAGNAYASEIKIAFTTVARQQPMARLFNSIVAKDGSGDFTSLQAAIDAAPKNSASPYLIFVKEGVYNEHINIPAEKPYIHIIGEGRNAVSIEDNKLCGGLGSIVPTVPYKLKDDGSNFNVQEGATIDAFAANTYFEGINMVNSYGRDGKNGPQALAIYADGDRVIINKCGLISYQDTYLTAYTKADSRQYVKDSWIEGAVDFIYGGGDIYFDHDTINVVRKNGGYIVAPSHTTETKWGYVFDHNIITSTIVDDPIKTQCYFGRPWTNAPKTVFLHTQCEISTYDGIWFDHMGGLPALWAVYDMWDKSGKAMSTKSISQYYKTVDGEKVYGTAKNSLTDEEANQYTLKNVLRGNDAWQPELICEQTAAPEVSLASEQLSWDAIDYAICYVILKDGKAHAFTTTPSYTITENGEYAVKSVNEFGGLSESSNTVKYGEPTKIDAVSSSKSNGAIYNIMGQKVSSFAKGIMIINGKKIVR